MTPTTENEWGIQSVWSGDRRHCLHWVVRGNPEGEWIDWWVSDPNVGVKETEYDPLMEGCLTKERWEFITIGSLDLDDVRPGELFEILETVKLLRRHLA